MNKTINMIFNRFNEYVKNTCTYYFVIYRWYCYTHRHLWRSSDCYERFFRNIISNGGNAWRYIRNRKLKKGRQYKDGMKRDKKTNHTITAHTQLKTEKHETRCKYLPKKTEKHETRCKYLPKKTEKHEIRCKYLSKNIYYM